MINSSFKVDAKYCQSSGSWGKKSAPTEVVKQDFTKEGVGRSVVRKEIHEGNKA